MARNTGLHAANAFMICFVLVSGSGCASNSPNDFGKWDLLNSYPVDPREWGKPGRDKIGAPVKLGNPPRPLQGGKSVVDGRNPWLSRPDYADVACRGQPEECAAYPMVPHCHGIGELAYCHSHPGGEYPHTHRGDLEFDSQGHGVQGISASGSDLTEEDYLVPEDNNDLNLSP